MKRRTRAPKSARLLMALLFTASCYAMPMMNAHPPSSSSQTVKPNVIIVLSDDQGYGDLSAHGNPVLKTPNLDKLHRESVRLTDFHVAPMCTPTRGQLMTGVDALRNGATSVTAGRSLLRPGFPTMAEIFKAGGYRTAIFGKWHLGDSYPNLPHHRGFDEAVYHMGWGVMSVAEPWLNDNFDDYYYHNGKLEQYKGYCTDIWFDLSMKWMKDRRERNEPFFLYLPTNAPHGPAWVPQKYKQLYDLVSDPGQQRDVADMQPAIARQMRAAYDRWWAEVEPRLNDFVPIVIGAQQQNPITLTAVDWANVYCDNVVNCVRPGENKNAPWTVAIERNDRYEFTLRRWPKEADIAISAGAPEAKLTDGVYPAGKALPIAKARLKIGDFDQTVPVGATDKTVVFTVPLKAAAKLQMQTWFYDAQGKELCGAYYADARRL